MTELDFARNGAVKTRRVTNEEVVEAYRTYGNVWKAAKSLGISGQSLWERLRAIGHKMHGRRWNREELLELERLVVTCTIGEISSRLGRPYAAVACKISELGIGQRIGNRRAYKHPRPALSQKLAKQYLSQLPAFQGSLRQFARLHGTAVDSLVKALQDLFPDEWKKLAAERGVKEKLCTYCQQPFYPLGPRQQTCSKECRNHARVDRTYFGGRRREAVGLLEGICQICGRTPKKGLSVHHVLGKDKDPDNQLLMAVCPGCHRVIEQLARMAMIETTRGWENLIHLALLRRTGGIEGKAGIYAEVEIEWLESDDMTLEEELEPTAEAI